MSMMKRYLEDNIDKFSDEELLSQGIDQETINLWRASFSNRKKRVSYKHLIKIK